MSGNNKPMASEGMKPLSEPVLPKSDEGAGGGGTFNLKWLLTTVLAIWPWLLGSIIISLIVGNIYLRYYTPVYKASAELLLHDSKKGGSSDDILSALKTNNNNINIDNEIEILKSRTTMINIVNKLTLNIYYTIEGRFKQTELYSNKPFEFVKVDSFDGTSKLNV